MSTSFIRKLHQIKKRYRIRLRSGLYRLLTAPLRPLPTAIIIGAQKSGTTALYEYLIQHPDIVGSQSKEVHYFDHHFRRGINWYRSFFPIKHTKCVIEASPSYLFLPGIAQRISATIPEVKLIAILRNPTDRAISSYYHQVRGGNEKLPIMEALLTEEERIQAKSYLISNGNYNRDLGYLRFSYKSRGLYLEQLERYWKLFPREQLFIINYDDFVSDPIGITQKVFHFLGVDSKFPDITLKKYNVGINKQKEDDSVLSYLNEYFAPHIQALAEALEIDLDW